MTLSSRQLLWSCLTLVSLATGVTSQAVPAAGDADCPADLVTFEVITGNIMINIQKKLLEKDDAWSQQQIEAFTALANGYLLN